MSLDPAPRPTAEIENLLAEDRTFPPDPAFTAQANATMKARFMCRQSMPANRPPMTAPITIWTMMSSHPAGEASVTSV